MYPCAELKKNSVKRRCTQLCAFLCVYVCNKISSKHNKVKACVFVCVCTFAYTQQSEFSVVMCMLEHIS